MSRSVQPWSAHANGQFAAKTSFDAAALPTCVSQERPLDALLVIDQSSSMASNDAMAQAIDAAIAFAEALASPNNRTGTIVFNDVAQTLTPLGASSIDLRAKAMNVRADGGTAISAGLSEAWSVPGW
ncbi:MAG: VWA domain-containing protein [Anaerolineae bacterium]|nr:MAG: VWA domain-containing protein [Anaerolineae bacterium]